MENIGALAILLAFCLAVYAVIGSVVGKLRKNSFLIVSAERAVYSIWILLTTASGILIYSLMTGDFRLGYVAAHSDSSMPAIYKFTAWWGGQEGSLLLWSWLLSTYSAVVVFMNRRKLRDMMPWVTAVLMTTQTFFLILVGFAFSPFQVLIAGRGNIVEGMGKGLNPLLQYWTMVIHPPMLYLGYVGFTVPFAFAIASLITKQPGDSWIHTTRRWTIVTWLFQSTGILLGAGLGVRGAGMGRILGLGSGGKRIAAAMDHGDCVSSLGDDAGKKGNDEGVEHGADFSHLFPVHLRNIPDALGRGELGARVRAIADRDLLRGVSGDWNRCHHFPDSEPVGLSEEAKRVSRA